MGTQILRLGDCLDVMKKIPDGIIHAVICDPPYGVTSNKWDTAVNLKEMWRQLLRIGKANAVFCFTSCQPFTTTLIASRVELWRHEWVWIKNRGSNFANTVREPFKEHETVQVFSRGKWTYNKQMQERTGSGKDRAKYGVEHTSKSENYREFEGRKRHAIGKLRIPSSWQKFNICTGKHHPTAKPVELMEYLVRTYTNERDIVLDPFMGSGTTCLAAQNLNRRYIGIEKDEKYFNVACKRLGKSR